MRILLKPNQYSKYMQPYSLDSREFLDMIHSPAAVAEKDRAPLFIYGTVVPSPEPDPETCRPRCTGANVQSIYMLQLDYDSGMGFHEFIRNYDDKFNFAMYSSFSYGFKQGDRFRVLVPLKQPLDCSVMGQAFTRVMSAEFPGCDPSCFSRGHFQIIPCTRGGAAPYKFAIRQYAGKHYEIPLERIHTVQNEMEAEAERARSERERQAELNQADAPTNIEGFVKHKLEEFGYAPGNHHMPLMRTASACAARGFDEADCESELQNYQSPGHDYRRISGIVEAAYKFVSRR